MNMRDRRSGASGQLANELESVLTAVMSSADEIADGTLKDSWQLQRELGALEDSLTRALALVDRLRGFVLEIPAARLSREDFVVGGPGSAEGAVSAIARPRATVGGPVFVGTAGALQRAT